MQYVIVERVHITNLHTVFGPYSSLGVVGRILQNKGYHLYLNWEKSAGRLVYEKENERGTHTIKTVSAVVCPILPDASGMV
ncbi:MAG: hypothetical protein Q8L09_02320 [Candidatus Moranbacteria bacterium]|nr:hypothetical protein [Candidatus Moranbacteria bacterium]